MNTQQLPPFTPIGAVPVTALDVVRDAALKTGRKKAKTNGATVAKGKKKSRPRKEGLPMPVGSQPAFKRARSARVAPLMMDAAQALAALNGLGRKEVESMQALVQLLNPLPRPARARVLAAVAMIVGGK